MLLRRWECILHHKVPEEVNRGHSIQTHLREIPPLLRSAATSWSLFIVRQCGWKPQFSAPRNKTLILTHHLSPAQPVGGEDNKRWAVPSPLTLSRFILSWLFTVVCSSSSNIHSFSVSLLALHCRWHAGKSLGFASLLSFAKDDKSSLYWRSCTFVPSLFTLSHVSTLVLSNIKLSNKRRRIGGRLFTTLWQWMHSWPCQAAYLTTWDIAHNPSMAFSGNVTCVNLSPKLFQEENLSTFGGRVWMVHFQDTEYMPASNTRSSSGWKSVFDKKYSKRGCW